VEEDEGELVLLVGDLDAVCVHGVQVLGDLDRDFPRGQEVPLLLPREIEISLGFIRKNFTPPAIRLMLGAVMAGRVMAAEGGRKGGMGYAKNPGFSF
jgi:hypothetical protein